VWEIQRARALLAAQQAEQERSPTLAGRVLQQLKPFEAMIDGDADLLDARAICRLLTGQRAEAIRDWERLLSVDPERLSALQSLLTILMEMGETTRAAGYAERLLALNPKQADVLWRYSVLSERLGLFERAGEAIEQAWRLNPASAAIRQRRAALQPWAVEKTRTPSPPPLP
jgi:tetratricopeptide (TPR) repeat protein